MLAMDGVMVPGLGMIWQWNMPVLSCDCSISPDVLAVNKRRHNSTLDATRPSPLGSVSAIVNGKEAFAFVGRWRSIAANGAPNDQAHSSQKEIWPIKQTKS
jgi:hypothetical protein